MEDMNYERRSKNFLDWHVERLLKVYRFFQLETDKNALSDNEVYLKTVRGSFVLLPLLLMFPIAFLIAFTFISPLAWLSLPIIFLAFFYVFLYFKIDRRVYALEKGKTPKDFKNKDIISCALIAFIISTVFILFISAGMIAIHQR